MINWSSFPRSRPSTDLFKSVVDAFSQVEGEIGSVEHDLPSDLVLAAVRPGLEELGFDVERGKQRAQKVEVPVLYGRNGQALKHFDADAWHVQEGMVLEIEAGRGVTNYQFLKDLFQASVMQGVDYFGVAVRNTYKRSRDFETVETFFQTLYESDRLTLPFKNIIVIGY